MSLLRRIEKSLDQRLRGIFGATKEEPGAREAIELYRDALDQIAARASIGKRGDRVFPFNLVTIELMAQAPERKALLDAIFNASQVVDDIRATLTEERITIPHDLTVMVRYPDDAVVEMRILCEKTGQTPAAAPAIAPVVELKPMRLMTLTGSSSSDEFVMARPHVNLGRESEVVDSLGRAIRRNDLFFPEAAHDANASVSRSHAHIHFEAASGDWRIYDDGSSLGTVIFREGRRIDVPAHSGRGVVLRPGDEIYLGQVRLLFAV
jgi:hypothetical protein